MSGWNETPAERAERVRKWKVGVGDWLREFEWSHWVTLTVAGRWSPQRLEQAFVDEFVRFATKVSQGPVPYAFSIESGALGDNPHVHALLCGTEHLRSDRLAQAWRHGRATVEVYDAQRGSTHYLAKGIGSKALSYDWSRRMPPLVADLAKRAAA